MEQDLKQLGLSQNEIKVYLSLMKIGETSVGGIINDLKIHRQIVYNALSELEGRNMVEKNMKNKIWHFKLSDPKILVENLQKQELIARRLSQNIETEMKKSRHEYEVNIYEGRVKIQQFYINTYKSCPIGTTIYIIAGTGLQLVDVLGEEFLYTTYENLRAKRKIYSKHLATMSFQEEEKKMKLNQELRETKYLPFIDYSLTVLILPESVVFQSFFEMPIMIEFKNKIYRDSYLEKFNKLWQTAK